MNLQGKIVVITGTSRGIGHATAELFKENGATVLGCSRGQNSLFQCNVSDEAQVTALFKQVQADYGRLDILINNAGMIKPGPFMDQPLSVWDDHYQTNVRSVVHCSQEAFKLMKDNGGSIVNVSSLAGVQGAEKFAGLSAYVMSKSAVTGITEALAAEGKSYGIRVNAVAPGAVDTQMLKEAAPFLSTSTTPQDIAKVILFLADASQSGKVTGCILPVYSND